MTVNLKPMSEFDPAEPAMVHDRMHDRVFAWSPDFETSYRRYAYEQGPGIVNFDGALLDGWTALEGQAMEDRTMAGQPPRRH